MANDLLTVPKTPYDAPPAINLPAGVFDAAMKTAWNKSFYTVTGYRTQSTASVARAEVQECGFTVFKDVKTQDMQALNAHCSGSGSESGAKDARTGFQPDLQYPKANYQAVGIVHSHPGLLNRDLVKSLDSTDAAVMLREQLNFVMALTGSGVVELYLRTKATVEGFRDPVSGKWVDAEMKNTGETLGNIARDSGLGKKWEETSEDAAKAVAEHFQLAFYKGSGLLLTRVWPSATEHKAVSTQPHSRKKR